MQPMPYLTAKQTDTAEAKASDFGKATLYLLPNEGESADDPQPYANAICTFADRDFVILIHPDGTWVQLDKEWSQK